MTAWRSSVFAAALAMAVGSCSGPDRQAPASSPAAETTAEPSGTFGDDVKFLEDHTNVIVLASADGRAQVAIAPAYQGRVMTSTAEGRQGASYGYLHRPVIAQGTRQPHMTVLGGEDRFWLGPEGGQYALYFPPGAAFDTDQWQVPEPIDWGPWPVVATTARDVTFAQPMSLTNYAGTRFTLRVDRTIRLLDRADIERVLGAAPGTGTNVVAYESDNRITNTGSESWRKEKGLISIWILGMLRPAAHTTVVVPYETGSHQERGPVVNDAYFGAQPQDRLRVGDRAIFFRGDGKHRGKIGISRRRARDVAGSYDPDGRLLTLIQFTLPPGTPPYVNSMWARQDDPYGGDVINSYNDGPLGPGQPPLGPFYEVESSSPAAALAPGATLRHVHRTLHVHGPIGDLDAIARRVLGVSLAEIANALP
jgi:hypothetical protein